MRKPTDFIKICKCPHCDAIRERRRAMPQKQKQEQELSKKYDALDNAQWVTFVCQCAHCMHPSTPYTGMSFDFHVDDLENTGNTIELWCVNSQAFTTWERA